MGCEYKIWISRHTYVITRWIKKSMTASAMSAASPSGLQEQSSRRSGAYCPSKGVKMLRNAPSELREGALEERNGRECCAVK